VFANADGKRRIAAATSEDPSDPDRPFVSPDGEGEVSPARRQEQSEVISLIRVILEREIAGIGAEGAGRAPLERLLELVRARDHDRLRESYRYLISQVERPTEELERAREMLAKLLAAD
jgi:hypothetical protein